MLRNAEEQRAVDQATQGMALYQFHACPFCIRTRRALHRMNLKVSLLDAKHPEHSRVLDQIGGKIQVPCLRIDEGDDSRWMYESADIIAYLEQRFGTAVTEAA